jgi:S1-C subfamily serine protease
VDPSSPAAGSLTTGDVIQEINHKPIINVNDYRQAMAAIGKQQSVLLLVNHGGVTRYSVVEAQ